MRAPIAASLAAVLVLTACAGSAQTQPSRQPEATTVAVSPPGFQPPAPPPRTSEPLPTSEPTPVATARPGQSQKPERTNEPPGSPEPTPRPSAPSPHEPDEPVDVSRWSYEYSMYRPKTHSVQRTDWYCVPTSIQMMFNLILGQSDRSKANQTEYWRYAQANSTYPVRDNGADPGGWVAAMKRWGQASYSVGISDSMQAALRLAAKRMRVTGKPVGLIVWGTSGTGGHAWVMTGFRSTADPRDTDDFTVSSVQAMGSLWPYGTINGKPYDPGPKEWVEYPELRQKFTWFVDRGAAAWNGRWLTVLP